MTSESTLAALLQNDAFFQETLRAQVRDAFDDVLRGDARRLLRELMEGLLRDVLARELTGVAANVSASQSPARLLSSAAQAGGDLLKALERAQRNA